MDINFSICFLCLIFGQRVVCWTEEIRKNIKKARRKEFLEMKKENKRYKNKRYIHDM